LQEKNELRKNISDLQQRLVNKEQEILDLRSLAENELKVKDAKIAELTEQLRMVQQNALRKEHELREELINSQQQNSELQARIVLTDLSRS